MTEANAPGPEPGELPRFTLWVAPSALIALLTVRVWALGESYFLRDFLTNFIPLRTFLRNSLAQGSLPFWNPWIGGGLPVLAEPPASAVYPLGWPSLLFADQAWAYSVLVDAHLLLGALGMAWLMRRRVSAPAAVLSALTFGLAGLLVSNRINGCWALGYAWAPWFYSALLYFQARPSAMRVAPVAAVWGLQLLAPEPQVVYLEGLSVLCFLGTDARGNLRFLFGVALGGLLALGLSAPQWVPMLDTLPFTSRGAMTVAESAQWQWHPARLWEWVMPGPWGAITPTTTFWAGPLVTGPYFNFYFASLYLGVLALPLLAAAAMTSWRRHWPMWTAALLLVIAALGVRTPLYGWLQNGVPLFGLFRYPERLWLLPTLGAAVAMGFGLDAWLAAPARVKWLTLGIPAALAGAVMTAPGLVSMAAGVQPPPPSIRESALHALAFVGAAGLVTALRWRWQAWALVGIAAMDLTLAAAPHQASWKPPVLASPAPSEGRRLVLQADISQVLSKLDPSPASRRAVELTSWRPNWNILGHVRTTNAVSSLELKRRDLLLKGVGPEASALLYGTQWLVGKPGIPFRHFVAQPPSPQGWVEYQSQEAPKLVRCSTKFAAVASAEEALDRVKRGEPVVEAAVPSQNEGGEVPCELARLGDASFRVTSAPVETPLLVRVSESYLPGWSATAAGGTGLPVFASDVAFVGTVAPARSTELTFSYRPPHLAPMLGVSAGSWALLAILGTVAWRQRKND